MVVDEGVKHDFPNSYRPMAYKRERTNHKTNQGSDQSNSFVSSREIALGNGEPCQKLKKEYQ